MPREDSPGRGELGHHIILEEREQLSISGVEEVESFDENTILLTTARGPLEIQGDLRGEGGVDALIYTSEGRERGGLLSRLFG